MSFLPSLFIMLLGSSFAQPTPLFDTVSGETVYPELTTGNCTDCNLSEQAKWYFNNEIIAPLPTPASSLVTLPEWLEKQSEINDDIPIWIASPALIASAQLDASGQLISIKDGEKFPFKTVRQIPQNQSFWNQDTTTFLPNVIYTCAANGSTITLLPARSGHWILPLPTFS